MKCSNSQSSVFKLSLNFKMLSEASKALANRECMFDQIHSSEKRKRENFSQRKLRKVCKRALRSLNCKLRNLDCSRKKLSHFLIETLLFRTFFGDERPVKAIWEQPETVSLKQARLLNHVHALSKFKIRKLCYGNELLSDQVLQGLAIF